MGYWKDTNTDLLFLQWCRAVYRRPLPDLLRHANRGGIVHGESFSASIDYASRMPILLIYVFEKEYRSLYVEKHR